MSSRDLLLAAVQLFVNDTGISETRLLEVAGCDKAALRRLRKGRSITLETHDRILAQIAEFRRLAEKHDALQRTEAALREGAT